MRRRDLLAALAVWIAGCAGGESAGTESPTTSPTATETPPPTSTATSTETPTPTATETVTPAPTPTLPPVPDLAVRIQYTGEWSGALGVTTRESSGTRTIDGTGARTIDVADEAQIISCNAQKQDDSSRRLTVQILQGETVVAEESTTAEYGVAQTSQSFV